MLNPFHKPGGSPDWLGATQAVALLLAVENDREDMAQQILTRYGGTILEWFHLPGAWPPSYVIISHGDDCWAIFGGTNSAIHWVGNLLGAVGVPYTLSGVFAHAFFLSTARVLAIRVATLLGGLGGKRLHIFGHSYGGAVAFLAALASSTAASVEVLTTGQPRALSAGYSGSLPSHYTRVANTLDIVPQVPFTGSLLYVPLALAAPWSIAIPWQHYGTGLTIASTGEVTSYPNVATDLETGSGLIANALNDQHFISTYWQRITLAAAHDGVDVAPLQTIVAPVAGVGEPQSAVDVAPSTYIDAPIANQTYFNGADVLTPSILDTGTGESTVAMRATFLPSLNSGGTTVATYKVKLFYEFNNAGWSEIFWANTSNPTAAVTFDQSRQLDLMAFRPIGSVFRAATAYAWPSTRIGAQRVYNFTNPDQWPQFTSILATQSPVEYGEPTQVAAFVKGNLASGRTRTLLARGWLDWMVNRTRSGASYMNASAITAFARYFGTLAVYQGYGMATRLPTSTSGYQWNKVISITQAVPGVSLVNLSAADFTLMNSTNPQWLYFSGVDRHNMPQLRGSFAILAAGNNAFSISFDLPNGQTTYLPQKLRVRPLNYAVDPFVTQNPFWTFIEWRIRKTGRPTDLLRGRLRGATARH